MKLRQADLAAGRKDATKAPDSKPGHNEVSIAWVHANLGVPCDPYIGIWLSQGSEPPG